MTRDMAVDVARAATRRPRVSGQWHRLPLAVVLVALMTATLASAVIAVGLGPVTIAPGTVLRVLTGHLLGTPTVVGAEDVIVWQLRAPRVLLGIAVGTGLAVAGLVVQAMVRNPVGDPYILGLSSGASVGAVAVFTTVGSAAFGLATGPVAAFTGAALAGVAVFVLARVRGRLQPSRLVLAGIAVGQLLSGVTSFLLVRTRDSDAQQQMLFWMLGSLAGARWDVTVTCTSVVVISVLGVWWRSQRINLLVLGDDAAAALGSDATRVRVGFFGVVGLVTGTVVAAAGSIGFIGLIVPNLARLLLGADHHRCVPACALLGALLTIWADAGARLILAPSELPLGIVTAAVGVPFFLAVLRRGASSVGP